jgi:type II secretory pathway component PulF
MRFWMKNKFKNLFSAPDHHRVEQVLLLLENQMPYHTIQQSLNLKQKTLDEFVANLFYKAQSTYDHLSNTFSQSQLLKLHVQLYQFKRFVSQTIAKKSIYPVIMTIFSYLSFLFFYRVLYPMFLTLSATYKMSFLNGYALVSFVFLLLVVIVVIIILSMMRSPFQQTIFLRNLHKKYANTIVFDYYANVFTLVYNLCLSFGFSSLMTIELLRGIHDYPYLQAVAYDIHQECQQGLSLHKAIINQKLSLVLNQTIELGIAASDLPGYINRLSTSYQTIFMSKLKRVLAIFHLFLYTFMMLNLAMIILILQLPTKIMGELL